MDNRSLSNGTRQVCSHRIWDEAWSWIYGKASVELCHFVSRSELEVMVKLSG